MIAGGSWILDRLELSGCGGSDRVIVGARPAIMGLVNRIKLAGTRAR